jgi:Transposase DDE domain.
MDILTDRTLESNRSLKINFAGGDLSSDAGLLLIHEFIKKMGLTDLIRSTFATKDTASFRIHEDAANLEQVIYQIMGAYFTDDCADDLRHDPVFTTILGKDSLASQPTLSRFYQRMDQTTLEQLAKIQTEMRRRVYRIQKPEMVVFDIDSTLLETFGKQEGEDFNYHYQAHGYHPLVCYDALTGDALKIELREGNVYTSTGVTDFMSPLICEFQQDCPDTALYLRGDSGFAVPGLYELCEEKGVRYTIRLKDNPTLRKNAAPIEALLQEKIQQNAVEYAVAFGEFMYQAKSWDRARRVVCKVEKPQGQIAILHTFIVTDMQAGPKEVIRYYCNRGRMENFIKESKSGFDFAGVSSKQFLVNANRLQIHALVYNLLNWSRRLTFPESLQKFRINTLRLKIFKVAARFVRSGRYITFKLSSSCPYQKEYWQILDNISRLCFTG